MTNEGEPVSWADITRAIYKEAGLPNSVTDTTTKDYYAGKEGIAPRPLQSTLDLSKIKSAGVTPKDWQEDLKEYVAKEQNK
jgi:dTDP-4-dehydrorhamnose 3,5-epimerase